ncbi:(2,3-dihydroxybenzoyl)adenylate synthase [Pseudoalteromonas fenneropenaei]|uniref:(2,3-dihydroxybenzoyl)adenylate synthase n=1 Tax=Pseudoalteromonas fenneropenaei TaxID=1737459 RepID=A0ABV7CPR5_9GAMM
MKVPFTPWPAELAAEYRKQGYWLDLPLSDILERQVQAKRDAIAVICESRQVSYSQLDIWSDRLANYLQLRGLQSGDRALVQLPNRVEFYVCFFALLKIGVVPVNALFNHGRMDLFAYANQVQPKLLIVSSRHSLFKTREFCDQLCQAVPSISEIVVEGDSPFGVGLNTILSCSASYDAPSIYRPKPTAADEVAFFQLSGGSTGTPKLIPRTHNDYYYSIRQSVAVCQWNSSTRYLCALPAAHNFPLSSPGALGAFYAGGCVVLAPDPSPASCFKLIAAHQVNWAALVPPAVILWLEFAPQHQEALRSLQYLQVGGARLSEHVAKRVEPELGVHLQQVFGMAEGLVNYTRLSDPLALRLRAQGRPMSPADEIRVVDEAGLAVPPGQTGALLTRGPYTVRGYFAAPNHNALAFDDEGFYHTGDLVTVLEDGSLLVSGRIKDQINRGGEKIAAQEIENELMAHPQVRLAALLSVADEVMGEKSCAVLVCHAPVPKTIELRKYLRSRGVADFKIPDRFMFVDALPLTAVGKVDKKRLQSQLTLSASADRALLPTD